MPNSIERKHHDYSKFDHMSTEELEDILRLDAQLPNNEDSDVDVILYIMEVIAKRNQGDPATEYTDVHAAWASFKKNYLPYAGTKSLYDYEDTDTPLGIGQTPFKKDIHPQRKHRMMRVACVLLVLNTILFAGTLTANALGFDLWGAIATWTEDIFGFSDVVINKQEPDDLQKTLDKYDITTKVDPTWFPDGYSFESVDVIENPLRTTIHSAYSSKNGEILVTIVSLVDLSTSTYEKDSEDVITYTVDGIEHYIMTNLERTKVVWLAGNYECSITGNISTEEAEKMIDSIYGR